MDDETYRAFLDLLMVCAPCPISLKQDEILRNFADKEAVEKL